MGKHFGWMGVSGGGWGLVGEDALFDTALKELVNASLKIALEHCLSTVYCLMIWEIPFNYSFIIR